MKSPGIEGHWVVLVVVVPLLCSFLCFVLGRFLRRVPFYLALGASGFASVASLAVFLSVLQHVPIRYFLGGWLPPWGIEYRVDGLNAFMLLLVSGVSLLVTIYSKDNVPAEIKGEVTSFYTVYILLVTGLLGIVVTGDVFNLYVFLEISSLAAYTLIAAAEGRALLASFNYVIMGTVAACFYLLGVGYLYIMTGSLNMADLARLLPSLYHNPVVVIALAFFVVGLAIKVALFPLHTWLPDAYAYAPSTTSVIIASLMGKVGLYVLIRLLFSLFDPRYLLQDLPVLPMLSWLGAMAIIMGSLFALSQLDFKRMLAYSSVAQIGYVVLGMGMANSIALTGALLHVINHAVMKGGLFMAAGAIIQTTGKRQITDFHYLHRRMPFTMAALLLGALSMVGIPPTCGFFSKWYLILGAVKKGNLLFVGVILISSLLNALYFFRVLEYVFFKPLSEGSIKRREAPTTMLVPTLVMGGAVLLLGLGNQWVVSIVLKRALEVISWR